MMTPKNPLLNGSRTDLRRWRLTSVEGAHRWTYLTEEDAKLRPQSLPERYFLGLPTDTSELPPPKSYLDSAVNGLLFYKRLQLEEGHWDCSYGGPSFLLPGLVFALYISNTIILPEWKVEMTRYLAYHVNEDGGWGLYLGCDSTVFATALYYVVLRILGMEPTHPLAARARERLLALGGAVGVPQWGKFWLSCLNLYDWDGVNPVPPELWLLPDWVPFHPWRWWVHCRMVYLPTSLLYSHKCKIPLNPLIQELRNEIYVQKFSSIRFGEHRDTVAASDIKRPPALIVKMLNPIFRTWEAYLRPSWLHHRASDAVRNLVRMEDENTHYNNLAPVNKALQMTAAYFLDGEDSLSLGKHREALPTYLWQSDVGMTSGGTNGVQVWDTAFTILALVDAGLAQDHRFRPTMAKALDFLDTSQLRDNLDDPYRQPRKGGWPFSTKDNGYIVSDCAAESMKAVIMLQEECGFTKVVSNSRIFECVDTLLLMQNKDGGFGSYEKARGGAWLELLNPAEVFDRIMVEYSYPECTTAVLTSLTTFRRHFPEYRSTEIKSVISRAIKFILASQRSDGSWYGSWAICFTYATFFALESLATVEQTYQTSINARQACDWLVSKQKSDGGWGEHASSCELQQYVQHKESQVVNTAWATLALMSARYPDKSVIERGLDLIRSRQQRNGEWLQEDVEGVFNRTCMIEYPNYKFYFSIRALGKYEQAYLPWHRTCSKSTSTAY